MFPNTLLRGPFFRPKQSFFTVIPASPSSRARAVARAGIHFFILLAFLANTFGPLPLAQAQDFYLPAPGQMVALSPAFSPAVLKGVKLDSKDPFRFHFFVDRGGSSLSQEGLKSESAKLIKYFLASLTIPEKDLWVNLSPYEKDRIVPQEFGQTEMGRDLLAEDYLLKQITASLIYPESQLGKEFWKKVYAQAQAKYGSTNIPINTFNKVWIVPEKAVVYENGGVAFVLENNLKVMLEQDYLSLEKHEGIQSIAAVIPAKAGIHNKNDINALGSQIVREIVIPALTKEVNEGKNFAQLRQVFYSLILATWYKKKIKDGILNKVYSNQNKIGGVNVSAGDKDKIYQEYLRAFKKGVYNYIKEEPDPMTQQVMPRKYFSGGVNAQLIREDLAMVGPGEVSRAQISALNSAQLVDLDGDMTMAVDNNQKVDGAVNSASKIKFSRVDRIAFEIVPGIYMVSDNFLGYLQFEDNRDPESVSVPDMPASQREHAVDVVSSALSASIPIFNSMTNNEKDELIKRMLTAGHILFPKAKLNSERVEYFLRHEQFHNIYAADLRIKAMGDEAFKVLSKDGQIRFMLLTVFRGTPYQHVYLDHPDEFWAQYFYPADVDSLSNRKWAMLKEMIKEFASGTTKEAKAVEACLRGFNEEVLPQVKTTAKKLYIQMQEASKQAPDMAKVIMPVGNKADGAMRAYLTPINGKSFDDIVKGLGFWDFEFPDPRYIVPETELPAKYYLDRLEPGLQRELPLFFKNLQTYYFDRLKSMTNDELRLFFEGLLKERVELFQNDFRSWNIGLEIKSGPDSLQQFVNIIAEDPKKWDDLYTNFMIFEKAQMINPDMVPKIIRERGDIKQVFDSQARRLAFLHEISLRIRGRSDVAMNAKSVDENPAQGQALLSSWNSAPKSEVDSIMDALYEIYNKDRLIFLEIYRMAVFPNAAFSHLVVWSLRHDISLKSRYALLNRARQLRPLARQVILQAVREDTREYGNLRLDTPYTKRPVPDVVRTLSTPLSLLVENNIRTQVIPRIEGLILTKMTDKMIMVIEGLPAVGKTSVGKYIQKYGIAGINPENIQWLDLDRYVLPGLADIDGGFQGESGEYFGETGWGRIVNMRQFASDVRWAQHDGKKLIVITGFSAARFFKYGLYDQSPNIRVVLRSNDQDLEGRLSELDRNLNIKELRKLYDEESRLWKSVPLDLSVDVDKAMLGHGAMFENIGSQKGGIDLNPAQMNMGVKKEGQDFKFNFNGTEIDAAQVTGATFTIRTMTPVTNLPQILGVPN